MILRRIASLAWWWHLLAAAIIVAVLIGAAYQTHPSMNIAIGNRVQDDPLVVDFNAAERQPASAGGRTYRWTRGESDIVFPGIGRTATTVTLTIAGGANPDPTVVVLANGGEIGRLRLTPDFADYSFPIPAPYLTTGNLTLTLQAMPFHAPGDRRDLGVLVSGVRVQPSGGITRPPARTTLALWVAALLMMLALLAIGLRGWEAGTVTVAVAAGFAMLLIWDRLFITLGAQAWPRVAAGTLLLAVALRVVVPPLLRRLGIPAGLREARWLLAVAVGVFAVRLGGLYHPAMIVSDLIFHVHRFEDLINRHIWYQEIPAIYDQNRPVPYPPGAYLLFAPFAPLVRNRADLLTIGTQLLDMSRMLVIGLVVWRTMSERQGVGGRRQEEALSTQHDRQIALSTPAVAGAVATLLAGIVPIAFLIFSWGNLTNAVGEWALTLLFALLALGGDRLQRPGMAVAFVVVVLVALLSHIGVAVTAVALLGVMLAAWAMLLVWQRRAGGHVVLAPWLAAVVLTCIAGILTFALFYRIPLSGVHAVMGDTSITTPSVTANGGRYEIGGPRPDPTIGLPEHRTDNPVVAVAGQLGEEGYAFYRVWPLLLAPLGWWVLVSPNPLSPFPKRKGGPMHGASTVTCAPRSVPLPFREGAGGRLAALCIIWFGVSLLFLLIGVLAGRYVRYAMTAIPAVAVGAGVAVGYGWRWRWGRVLALLLLAFSIASTLLVWYGRITRAYHF